VKTLIEISDKLREKLEHLPELPGIYKMLDSRGDIIYVGKSKCLKKRVRSYFTGNHQWSKIKKMVLLIHDIETVITDTHLEARLLECQLIKDLKPVFNSQMKNDKEYVYLKIEKDTGLNALTVAAERSDDFTYGPFRREYTLKEKIAALQCIFPIVKKDSRYEFEYHLFPAEMDQEAFEENRDSLIEVFSDDTRMEVLVQSLKTQMEAAADAYRYETAARLRDTINALNYISRTIWRYKEVVSQDILLKIPSGHKHKLFYISNGAIVLKKLYENPTTENIDLFIKKGYSERGFLSLERDEKAELDYRDILYSEISSLPNDMVRLIPAEFPNNPIE
jgi:excinuclease ABC subunit C